MMKKEYIKPIVTDAEISIEVIASSIPFGEDKESGITNANRQRGEWGNLWKN